MNLDELLAFIEEHEGAEATFPFGEDILVYKINGKMFALIGLNSEPLRINLKCPPAQVTALLEQFQQALPAYHMNKKHWITIEIVGDVSESVIKSLISQSYLIVNKKGKKSSLK